MLLVTGPTVQCCQARTHCSCPQAAPSCALLLSLYLTGLPTHAPAELGVRLPQVLQGSPHRAAHLQQRCRPGPRHASASGACMHAEAAQPHAGSPVVTLFLPSPELAPQTKRWVPPTGSCCIGGRTHAAGAPPSQRCSSNSQHPGPAGRRSEHWAGSMPSGSSSARCGHWTLGPGPNLYLVPLPCRPCEGGQPSFALASCRQVQGLFAALLGVLTWQLPPVSPSASRGAPAAGLQGTPVLLHGLERPGGL